MESAQRQKGRRRGRNAGRRDQAACTTVTHVDDLPDDCLVSIMCRIGSSPLPLTGKNLEVVEHPLQCAFICKRWREVADHAVFSLKMDCTFTTELAQILCSRFTNLTGLEIGSLHCTQLPQALSLLVRLESFSLIDSKQLPSLPSDLGNLSHLTFLRVTSCPSLQAWPDSLRDLKALRTLVIEWCGALPQSLAGLTSLESLRVEGFETLPEGIEDLPSLCRLEILNGFETLELPFSLTRLSQLQFFCLEVCPLLERLPPELGVMTTLKNLRLNFCGDNIPTLPESLGGLIKLESCRIDSFYELTSLPASMGTWSSLTRLEIESCEYLRALPEEVGQLQGLKNLHLVSCRKLRELPDAIGQLRALEELEIVGCSNELLNLPQSLGHLTQLKVFKIRAPRLHELPESAGDWQMLHTLEIGDSKLLERLPEGLGRLGALRELHVAQCPSLVSLPRSLGEPSCGIEVLRLMGCPRLTELRDTVEEMSSLRVLEIRNCDALEPLPLSGWRQRGLRVEHS